MSPSPESPNEWLSSRSAPSEGAASASGSRWRRGAYYALCAALAGGTLVLVFLSWQQMLAAPEALPPAGAPTPSTTPSADSVSADATAPPSRSAPSATGTLPLAPWLAIDPEPGALSEAALSELAPWPERLEREPAGLAAPPGGQRQWRFKRSLGDAGAGAGRGGATHVEEVAAWRIEGGSMDALAAFYRARSRELGFEPIGDAGVASGAGAVGGAGARYLNFVRYGEPGDGGAGRGDGRLRPLEMLTVRLAPANGSQGAGGTGGTGGTGGSGGSVHALIAFRYAMR